MILWSQKNSFGFANSVNVKQNKRGAGGHYSASARADVAGRWPNY